VAQCAVWETGPDLSDLTDTCSGRSGVLSTEELLAFLNAIGHPQRLRILAELANGRVHVSELARRLGLSRPLLYMHLDRLEKANLVEGRLELSADGKAMKYFTPLPFTLQLDLALVRAAVAQDLLRQGDETEKGT
jgi:predicted transcriptional regulator